MFTAFRDLPRLREISSVLIRHGLGDLVRRTGMARGPPRGTSRGSSTSTGAGRADVAASMYSQMSSAGSRSRLLISTAYARVPRASLAA